MKKLPTSAIERLSVDDFRQAKKIPVIIILDNVRSQSNIGSVFRTSDAFRIEALFLCGISATPLPVKSTKRRLVPPIPLNGNILNPPWRPLQH